MSDYMWFEGVPFPDIEFQKEILEDVCNEFLVKEEDLILLAYPKSGTNWLAEIVCLIQTKGDPRRIQSMPNWDRVPWLESKKGYPVLIHKEEPRLMKSHLPIHLFSKSLFSSKAKVIYLIRNPRDVLVSGYFFWGKANFVKNPESLETYFEWFLKGNDRISLNSSGSPGNHSVDHAGLKVRNLPATASQVLGSKVCSSTAWHFPSSMA